MLFVIPKIITFNYEFIPQDLTEKERTKSEKIRKSWRSCLLTPFSNEPDMHEENEFWLNDHVIFPIGNASFIKDGWITNIRKIYPINKISC